MKRKKTRSRQRSRAGSASKKFCKVAMDRCNVSLAELLASSNALRRHLIKAGQELLLAFDEASRLAKRLAKKSKFSKEYPSVLQAFQAVSCNVKHILKKI